MKVPIKPCIYCPEPKAPLSAEHVLPDALGCDAILRDAVCRDCNSGFGHGLEAALLKSLEWYRWKFEVASKNGTPPRLTATVTKGDEFIEGRKVQIDNKGTIKSKPVHFFGKSMENGQKVVDFRVYDESYTKELEKCFRRKDPHGKSSVVSTQNMDLVVQHEFDFSFLTKPDTLRCISKFALNYYAWRMGADLARDSQFDRVRQFIKQGTLVGNPPTYPFFHFEIHRKVGIYPPQHLLLLIALRRQRKIVAITALFGLFFFYTILTEDYRGLGEWWCSHEFNPNTRECRDRELQKLNFPKIPFAEIIWQGDDDRRAARIGRVIMKILQDNYNVQGSPA